MELELTNKWSPHKITTVLILIQGLSWRASINDGTQSGGERVSSFVTQGVEGVNNFVMSH
jgi:hypothetical protein